MKVYKRIGTSILTVLVLCSYLVVAQDSGPQYNVFDQPPKWDGRHWPDAGNMTSPETVSGTVVHGQHEYVTASYKTRDGSNIRFYRVADKQTEATAVQTVHIYPNPARDKVVLELHGFWLADTSPVEILIYDIYGREVHRAEISKVAVMRFECGNLGRGIYTYSIFRHNRQQLLGMGKLIIL